MGEQSYKLALPPHLHVHNVFHINLLKKYVPSLGHILDLDDNVIINQEEFRMEPEQILKIREKQLRNWVLRDVLVQWKGYPVEDASWEDWNKLVAQFPYLQRWFILLSYLFRQGIISSRFWDISCFVIDIMICITSIIKRQLQKKFWIWCLPNCWFSWNDKIKKAS